MEPDGTIPKELTEKLPPLPLI